MIKTVGDLIKELRRMPADASIRIAVGTATTDTPQAETELWSLKQYYAGTIVIPTMLPEGYTIHKRKSRATAEDRFVK